MQLPIAAFLYDFDKTLCTTDMQDYAFIPSLGMTPRQIHRQLVCEGLLIAFGVGIAQIGLFSSLLMSGSRVPRVLAADGYCADVYLAHPLTGGLWRPELTVCIDVRSGFVPWWRADEHEGTYAVQNMWAECFAKWNHVPPFLYVDNGSGHKNRLMSDDMTGFYARAGIQQIIHAIPGNPHGKGWLERFFRSMRDDFLKLWHHWWEEFLTDMDATPLLAHLGFAPQGSFSSEPGHRLRRKLLPMSPDTTDLSELFGLLFPSELDARWLRALDERTLRRLRTTLFRADARLGAGDQRPSVGDYALRTLLDALASAISQISAVGQSADVRARLSPEVKARRPFLDLPIVFETLREAVVAHGRQSAPALVAVGQLREQLDACRAGAATVYTHLQEHGISVHIEFQLRQMRQRIIRVKALLLCLETDAPAQATRQFEERLLRMLSEVKDFYGLIHRA